MSDGDVVARHEILPLLGADVERAGEWVMAYCPAHSDGVKHNGKGGRSLGLSDKGVLRCFAGCTFSDIMDRLDRGRNGTSKAMVPSRPIQATASGEKLVNVYQFFDSTGKCVAEKARFESTSGKRFMWRMPGVQGWPSKENGGGLIGLHVHDVPLYGQADLSDGNPALADWVIVTEGEKACDAVMRGGVAAVTGGWGASQTVFGAQVWEPLRGKNVALWPDNDEPGRRYMAVVARELRGIARTVITISAPVGHKQDAADYLAAGGDVGALFSNVLAKPVLDILSATDFRVRIPTDAGILTVDMVDVLRGHGVLEGEMTFTLAGTNTEPFAQRTNILSASTREMLVRSLAGQFGKTIEPNWTVLVSIAYARIRQGFEQVASSVAEEVDGDDSIMPVSYLLEPYIARGSGVILFGPPGKGKSWTALLMAVSVNHGVDKIWPVKHATRALYINLERSKESMKRRIGQVNKALGLPAESPLLMINKRGATLHDVMASVSMAIRTHGVELIILDSMSRAGVGDLNSNESGNRVADALNSLGTAWLAIAHAPRADDTHVFGSVMFDAAADVVVSLVTEQTPGSPTLGVGLKVTKANDMAIPVMMKLAYEFDSEGLASVRSAKSAEFVDVEDREALAPRDAVRRYLVQNGEATATEIATGLGRNLSYVARILRDGAPFVMTKQVGREKYYGVQVAGEQPTKPVWWNE